MYALTERQIKIKREVQEFAARYIDERSVQKWCAQHGLPDEVMRAYLESGLGLYGAPETFGGVPATYSEQMVLIEETARLAGTVLPFGLQTYNLMLLSAIGEGEQIGHLRETYRETGFPGFSIAITEPQSGSDVFFMKTRVDEFDGRLVMNGVKTFVGNGEYAPSIMVVAIDSATPNDEPSYSFWLVPRACKGIRTYPMSAIGWHTQPFCEIEFDNVEVKPEYLLGRRGFGRDFLFHSFGMGRCNVAASSLGLARAAMEDAVLFASRRQTFGHRLVDYQMIDELLVDMETNLINMRNFLYETVEEIDEGRMDYAKIAMMKRYVTNAAFDVADKAMKVFGGLGYTSQMRISRIWLDCRGNQFAEGTEQIMVRASVKKVVNSYLAKS
jgi:alkylation response protein AidB-like acyl-CoA dehydrogenase